MSAKRRLTPEPLPIELLSDNGSIYTSNETRDFGASIGFEMCTTPPYSPESNGMAESLVKSFKRDYVYLADLRRAPCPHLGRGLQPRPAPQGAQNAFTC
jgi:transposase InsO family protein